MFISVLPVSRIGLTTSHFDFASFYSLVLLIIDLGTLSKISADTYFLSRNTNVPICEHEYKNIGPTVNYRHRFCTTLSSSIS